MSAVAALARLWYALSSHQLMVQKNHTSSSIPLLSHPLQNPLTLRVGATMVYASYSTRVPLSRKQRTLDATRSCASPRPLERASHRCSGREAAVVRLRLGPSFGLAAARADLGATWSRRRKAAVIKEDLLAGFRVLASSRVRVDWARVAWAKHGTEGRLTEE